MYLRTNLANCIFEKTKFNKKNPENIYMHPLYVKHMAHYQNSNHFKTNGFLNEIDSKFPQNVLFFHSTLRFYGLYIYIIKNHWGTAYIRPTNSIKKTTYQSVRKLSRFLKQSKQHFYLVTGEDETSHKKTRLQIDF